MTCYGTTQHEQHDASTAVNEAASILQFNVGRQSDNEPLICPEQRMSSPTIDSSAEFEHVDPNIRTSQSSPLWCMWCHRCPRLLFSVILPLIASFLFVIFGIYNFSLEQTRYRNLFMCYRSGYWLALSMAALVGYAASRRFPSGPMNPSGFEYFVILSCIGPVLQSIFTIVANLMGGFLVPTGMFLTDEITNILHLCTQVVFYAYAKTIQIRTDQVAEDDNFEVRCKRSILMGVVSYFAVCNFAIWVENSFIETRASATSWQKDYFKNWPVIYNIFNPLSLVFRFNSVLLFLNVLFDKRR